MRLIRVKQGDAVRLRWTSDRPIVLHLHGYDIETKVEPGAVAEMAFTARATGSFPVEEHTPDARGGHSHGEAPLVRIEVRPRWAVAPGSRRWRWRQRLVPARGRAPTASDSATSCRCRSRSTFSGLRRWLRCPSSSSACSCAAAGSRAAARQSTCSHPLGRIWPPGCLLALRLAVLACSFSTCWPASSATRTPTATSRRPWSGSSGGWALPTLRPSPATCGRSSTLGGPSSTVRNGLPAARAWGELGWAAYPQALGVWPACLLLLAFAWIELVYPNAASLPHRGLAIAYSGSPGPACWRSAATLAAPRRGLLAGVRHLRPLRADEATGGRLLLRPFGAGLIGAAVSMSMMAFVLLLLATVLYDGLIGTGEWALLESACAARFRVSASTARRSRPSGSSPSGCLFLGAYLGICAS